MQHRDFVYKWLFYAGATLLVLLIPETSGGSETTYVPDYVFSSSSNWHTLYVGGHNGDDSYAGLLCFDARYNSSLSSSYVAARTICEA